MNIHRSGDAAMLSYEKTKKEGRGKSSFRHENDGSKGASE